MAARNDLKEHTKGQNVDDVYESTNTALHKIVPGRSKQEWQITEKLDKHRNDPLNKATVVRDGMFYSEFIQEVLELGLSTIQKIDELPLWKSNYDYSKLSKQIFSIKTTLIVTEHTCLTTPFLLSSDLPNDEYDDFIEYAGLSLNKMKMNDSLETTKFLRNSNAIFGNVSVIHSATSSNNVSFVNAIAGDTCNKTKHTLNELYMYKLRRRENIFNLIEETNSVALKENVILFSFILTAVFLTVVCIVVFGYLLRYECRVSVGVSDWLENVMTEVKDQELYHASVFKRVSSYRLPYYPKYSDISKT